MLFSSMTFIYVFLPVVTTLYLILRPELRNYLLLVASLVFYAWGEPKYLAVMLISILVNYVFGLWIEKARVRGERGGSWMKTHLKTVLLVLAISIDLGILAYFKYFNFLLENLKALFSVNYDFIKVVLPIGISFYTFQAVSYLMDIHRGGQRRKTYIS